MMRRIGWAAASLVLAACVNGCMMPTEKPAKGDKLLDFPVYTLDGQQTSLVKATQGKVAVIKFGASWCTWCTRQIPALNQIAARYPKDTVVVVDIDLQESPKVVQAYAQKNGVAYTMLLDPRGAGAQLYEFKAIPVTIIAGPDGTIAYRGTYSTFNEMDRVVASLVAKPKP